jgi:2-haloalkanoic acid dehalogenase type II
MILCLSVATKTVRAIAIDCYGTLVDFADEAFVSAYDEVCRLQGLACSGRDLWDQWMEVWRQMAEEGRARENPPDGPPEAPRWYKHIDRLRPADGPVPSFRTYREEWLAHFARAFANLGVEGDPEAAYRHVQERLAEALAYPEAQDVLAALRPRFRLALLSNADDDFLLPCLAKNGLDFEVVVSSEGARAYKPHRAIFQAVADALSLDLEEILYVGDSRYSDVLGAKHAGMPMAWLNRPRAELPEDLPRPDYEIQSLAELLPLVGVEPLQAAGR